LAVINALNGWVRTGENLSFRQGFSQIFAEFLLVNLTSVYLGFIDPTRASNTGYFRRVQVVRIQSF
jgi:hypothetical protein